ncbi:Os11g0158666, partial [Oryza sativa Japonica Group]
MCAALLSIFAALSTTPPLTPAPPPLLPPGLLPSSPAPAPPPPSWSLVSSRYISSTIGFHSLTLALMNQFETWLLVRPVCLASMILSESLGYLHDEVFEEPSPEDGDGALGEAALGAPRAALHHAQLLQRALLPELVVDVPEPGPHRAAASAVGVDGLPQRPARRPHLPRDRVPQAPELPRDGPQRQRRVRPRRPAPRHRLERRHHHLHLLVVLPVPLLHLIKHVNQLSFLHLQLLPLRRRHLRRRRRAAALGAAAILRAAAGHALRVLLLLHRGRALRRRGGLDVVHALADAHHLVEQLLRRLEVLGAHHHLPVRRRALRHRLQVLPLVAGGHHGRHRHRRRRLAGRQAEDSTDTRRATAVSLLMLVLRRRRRHVA